MLSGSVKESSLHDPLTILMPVRNGAATVRLAIADLVPQLRPEDELLVLDDGSSDSTVDVVEGFLREDSRVRLIRTRERGLVPSLNLGLMEAQHDWIARADADDRYPADRLAIQRAARTADVVLIAGDYGIAGGGRSLGYIPGAVGHPFVAASLIHAQRLPHPGVVFHRAAVLASGGYRAQDFPAEDFALWLRMLTVGKFVGVPHAVVTWSMSAGSVSHRNQKIQRQLTRELLRDSRIPSLARAITPEDVLCENLRYASCSFRRERQLLLLNDLWALSRVGTPLISVKAAVTPLVAHPILACTGLLSLNSDRLRRRRHRSDFTMPGGIQ